MTRLDLITQNIKLKITIKCSLWHLERYQTRCKAALGNISGWNKKDNFKPANTGNGLSLPPLTKTSSDPKKDEHIKWLDPEHIIQVERILFHSKEVKNDKKAYQCLFVSTEIEKKIEKKIVKEKVKGFVWTVYEGTDYAKILSAPSKPGTKTEPKTKSEPTKEEPKKETPLPKKTIQIPDGVQIEVKVGQTTVVDIRVKAKTSPSTTTKIGIEIRPVDKNGLVLPPEERKKISAFLIENNAVQKMHRGEKLGRIPNEYAIPFSEEREYMKKEIPAGDYFIFVGSSFEKK